MFHAIEKNGAETDYNSFCPTSAEVFCYADKGKVRAQGVKAEISGAVLERLQLFGGYTYTQTQSLNTLDSSKEGGVSNTDVPRHMLRVWGDYPYSINVTTTP